MDGKYIQEKVRFFLDDTGRTQKWLAKKLNVSQPTLSLWLKGKASFSHRTLLFVSEIIEKYSD